MTASIWSTVTLEYQIDITDTAASNYYALPSEPTTKQLALMDDNATYDAIIDGSSPGTIGMFGAQKVTGDQFRKYYFWFQFKPADNFCALATASTFRVLFQMGDGSSDWEGVRWYNDGSEAAGFTGVFSLQPSSLSNSNTSNPSGNERDNSTFEGYYDCDNNQVTIIRETERDEQTNTDETIIRIEAARVLDAIYWDSGNNRQTFEITIEGGYKSVVALSAAAIATMGLLTF